MPVEPTATQPAPESSLDTMVAGDGTADDTMLASDAQTLGAPDGFPPSSGSMATRPATSRM
ncbi:MAG: hypothetical protein KUG77_14735, partial [Nannocystaceae bacterium]|nr:hypothetical protein [Nannocystaceae bacterium]